MEKPEQTERQDDSALRPRPPGIDAHLRFVHGDLEGQALPLPTAGLTLGRGPAAGPRGLRGGELLLGDSRMSRPHALIEPIALGWQLVDLGSLNRGFVDGRAFGAGDRVDLLDGALVRLGDTLFVFRIGPPPAAPPGAAELDVFPGESPAACVVRARIRELSADAGHVLIIGETGTGKERVSRALGVPGRPFVPQNCAELTRDMVRSELFGHVRGAFTGAHAGKAGLVETADTGALFLDELGELALDVQADLLRFLEDGRYRPLGAIELRQSSARVIAATNVDLDEAVRRGRFRRDLRARLRASNEPLELPPLRARREDIPGWIQRFAAEAGTPADPSRWSAGAVECLLLYPWPENLRELRGMTRGLAAAGLDRAIKTDDLPERIRDHRRNLRASTPPPSAPPPPSHLPPTAASATDQSPSPGGMPSEPVRGGASLAPPPLSGSAPADPGPAPGREPTQGEIEAALVSSRGSMRETARILQVERTKLYRLCRSLGIDLDRFRAAPEQED